MNFFSSDKGMHMNSLKTMFSEAVGRRLFVLAILAGMGTAIGFGQPAAPTQLYATVLNDTSIQLNWRDNSSDEANFFIDARTSPLGIWGQAGSALQNATSTIINGRAPNGQYTYRVSAWNFETGFSDYSNTVTAKQTNGTFTVASASPRPTQTRGVIVGDLRDNGVQRIVVTAANSDSLYVFARSGASFVSEVGIKVGTSNDITVVAIGDVDNDGQTEFLISSVAAGMLYVYGWNGSTYIQERSQAIAAGYGVAIVDLDGDGANELVIANAGVQVFRYRSSSACSSQCISRQRSTASICRWRSATLMATASRKYASWEAAARRLSDITEHPSWSRRPSRISRRWLQAEPSSISTEMARMNWSLLSITLPQRSFPFSV